MAPNTPDRLLGRKDVLARTSFSHATLWRRIAAGDFPAQVKIGPGRRVAWSEKAVNRWIAEKLAVA